MTTRTTGGGIMNPSFAPIGMIRRQRPARGNLTRARQRFGAIRQTATPKPSRGILAFAIAESPVTTPTTSYQDLVLVPQERALRLLDDPLTALPRQADDPAGRRRHL